MTIGETVKMARRGKKMSQKELCDACKVSLPTIIKIEKCGDCQIRVLNKICEVLDLELVLNFK